MWYRKAMDLNDLNKDFALERENVIDAVEEENTKQNVEDLFSKVRAGEQYTSINVSRNYICCIFECRDN